MSFGILLVLQEGTHAAEAGPASPFEVNFGLFLWTWVVFAILLFVLWKYAWPGILKATEEREKKIRDQLAEAERLNSEAKATLAEAHQREVDARNSAQHLLAEARAAVDKERASAVEKVRNEQEAVLARTRLNLMSSNPAYCRAISPSRSCRPRLTTACRKSANSRGAPGTPLASSSAFQVLVTRGDIRTASTRGEACTAAARASIRAAYRSVRPLPSPRRKRASA